MNSTKWGIPMDDKLQNGRLSNSVRLNFESTLSINDVGARAAHAAALSKQQWSRTSTGGGIVIICSGQC
jgi:hypothetical protein